MRNSASTTWNLIESDQDIFTNMIKLYGIKNVAVEYVLESDTFIGVNDPSTYAITLAFGITSDKSPKKPDILDKDADNIIFSYQVVVNSCATQALLNTLANLDIEKGGPIQRFIYGTKNMDSFSHGVVLGKIREFEIIHNSYKEQVWNHEKEGAILGGGLNYGMEKVYLGT